MEPRSRLVDNWRKYLLIDTVFWLSVKPLHYSAELHNLFSCPFDLARAISCSHWSNSRRLTIAFADARNGIFDSALHQQGLYSYK